MTRCGIEKYDDLPKEVNFVDVDMLRHKLKRIDSQIAFYNKDRGIILLALERAFMKFNED